MATTHVTSLPGREAGGDGRNATHVSSLSGRGFYFSKKIILVKYFTTDMATTHVTSLPGRGRKATVGMLPTLRPYRDGAVSHNSTIQQSQQSQQFNNSIHLGHSDYPCQQNVPGCFHFTPNNPRVPEGLFMEDQFGRAFRIFCCESFQYVPLRCQEGKSDPACLRQIERDGCLFPKRIGAWCTQLGCNGSGGTIFKKQL